MKNSPNPEGGKPWEDVVCRYELYHDWLCVSVAHQGGPGHLYLLKNKVATFAKVEKEDDMIQ